MRSLSSIAWRSLASRRLRSLLTAAGIALGVAVVFAALATDRGVDESIERAARDQVGRADLRVVAFEEGGLSAATLAAVRASEGVAVASPVVEHVTFAQVPDRPDLGLLVVTGIDPELDVQVHDYRLTAGVFLGRDTAESVLLPDEWARERGIGVGTEVTFPGAGGEATLRVIGLLAASGPARAHDGQVAFVLLGTARSLFALGDASSRIDLRLTDGTTVETAEQALEQSLRYEPYLLERTSDVAAAMRASAADFRSTTLLLAAIALFVGGFLIYNTLSMSVAERIHEIGLLRAAGATSGQITGLFLLEALLLGILGCAAGLLGGVGLAQAMATWVRSTGSVPLDALPIPPAGAVLAVGLGLFVTVAAALRPARRAAGITPIEALRSRSPQRSGFDPRLRWLIAIDVVVAIVGITLWPIAAGGSQPAGGLARPYVVFALLVAVAIASPLFLGPLGRIAGLPFGALFRVEARLARGTLVRDRGRATLTLGALMVGLAMIVAIGTLAQGARRAGLAWLESVVPGDLVVRAVAPVPLDFADDLAAVDGVARVTPLRPFDIDMEGRGVDAVAIEPGAYDEAGALDFIAGDRGAALGALERGGAIVVPESEATRLGLAMGTRVRVRTGAGESELEVAGIVARSFPGRAGEAVFVGWRDARDLFGLRDATLFAVRTSAGAAPATVRANLADVAGLYAMQVFTVEQVAAALDDQLGRIFGLFDALALAALVVATLGIVNTLTMNVYERVREIGILRATGMTRRGVWRMVVVEAGILGLAGAVLGIVAGVAIGVTTLLLSRTAAFQPPLDLPWPVIGAALVLGVATAMLAAYYPARVAAGTTIVRAVRHQ